MNVSVSVDHGVGIIRVRRRHDWDISALADSLHENIDHFLASGIDAIVLDLSAVGYLDSADIGAIARTFKHVRGQSGRLTLVLDDLQLLMWRKVGFISGMPAYQSLEAAVAASVQRTGER